MENSLPSLFASVLQENVVPILSDAYLQPMNTQSKDKVVTTFWKQKNFETEDTCEFSVLYNVLKKDDKNFEVQKLNHVPIATKCYKLRSISPSRNYFAAISKQTNKETKKEEDILEIFSTSESKIICSVNLTSKNKHGIVHCNDTFGALNWSPDEKQLVYLSEKKKPKQQGYFEDVSPDVKNEINSPNATVTGEKFIQEESWGELLSDVVQPVVCVLNLESKAIETIESFGEIDPAQPVFLDNETIIFEGIRKKPFKLGKVYCQNRASNIYSLDMANKSFVELFEGGLSMNSCPRVSPDGSKIMWLYKKLHDSGDPHSSAVKLLVYDVLKKCRFVIDELKTDNEVNTKFPFYCLSLSRNCWFSDSKKVAVEVVVDFKKYVCVIDLQSQKTVQMYECSALFGVFDDIVLSFLMKLNWKNCILQVSNVKSVASSSDPIFNEFDVHEIKNNGILSFGIMPKTSLLQNKQFPVIVWPHGGPHSVYLNNFNLYLTAFAKIGFGIVYTNYTGSTGYTDESLYKLIGNIGTRDVQEVHDVAQLYFEMFSGKYDPNNVFMFGGSHGGFLTAHHIGQYPEMYRAAALRNPVVQISSMSEVSDIPDWTYVESGLPYNQCVIPDNKSLEVMLSKSPIQYVRNIKAPVLLCIGEKDLRVPPFQGKLFHKVLLAHDKKSRLLCYPNDSHPLSSIETECDVFVNVCRWFVEHGDLIIKS